MGKTGKRILIGVGAFIMLVGAGMMYLNNRNRTLSPPGNAELSSGNLNITLTYSRPSVRGRLIFGEESQGALQPYGKYWRFGANEATEITFSEDVLFNEKELAKGTYKIYAIPGKETFEVRVNTSLGDWGAFEPDYSQDILTTNVPTIKNEDVEQHTISLVADEMGVAHLIMEFSDVKLDIPIKLKD
jgi:hypothetical protein